MIASLIKNPSVFLWLAAFHLLRGQLQILIKGPLRIVSSSQAASCGVFNEQRGCHASREEIWTVVSPLPWKLWSLFCKLRILRHKELFQSRECNKENMGLIGSRATQFPYIQMTLLFPFGGQSLFDIPDNDFANWFLKGQPSRSQEVAWESFEVKLFSHKITLTC